LISMLAGRHWRQKIYSLMSFNDWGQCCNYFSFHPRMKRKSS
jgi:hypothetical protein